MRKIERFDKYMKIKGLNDNKVTLDLGLSVGTIGKSRKEGRDLSEKVVEQILKFYTDLNRIWLLTGEGDMLRPEAPVTAQEETRPRIPTTVAAGALGGFAESVKAGDCQSFPVVKAFPKYDYTIVVRGDSMTPEYKQGDEIAIRRVVNFIEWGKVYVLDTADGAILKRLYDNGDGQFRCVSINPEYPDFTLPRDSVYGVFQVVGLLRL